MLAPAQDRSPTGTLVGVLVVDDQAAFRGAAGAVVRATPGMRLASSAA